MKRKKTEIQNQGEEQRVDLSFFSQERQKKEKKMEKEDIISESDGASTWKPMAFLPRILYALIFCLILLIAGKGAFGQEFHQFTEKGLAYVFERQLNFVKVKKTVEELFGSANLAFFLPGEQPDAKKVTEEVSARVITNFNETKTGVQIETHAQATVVSDVDGIVIFAGEKPETGQTLIIQSEDGTEYWYGELENSRVQVYDAVAKGEGIGIAGVKDEGETSQYYFALKRDGTFIAPKQVLQLES